MRGSGAVVAGVLVFAGTLCSMAVSATRANAEAALESPYGYDRTWNAALRLVRVDKSWKVTEKDETSGYILFEYRSPENAKPVSGSVELVRGHDSMVNVLVQLPQMPRYHEQVVVDALAAKMRREYGDPPPPKKIPDAPRDTQPDGGEGPGAGGDAG